MNIVTLPPGTIMTLSGDTLDPEAPLQMSAATASRKGRMPVAGV